MIPKFNNRVDKELYLLTNKVIAIEVKYKELIDSLADNLLNIEERIGKNSYNIDEIKKKLEARFKDGKRIFKTLEGHERTLKDLYDRATETPNTVEASKEKSFWKKLFS